MWGVESVSADGVVLRLVVKTQPLQQWAVARELRRRIKERFDAEGVRVAHPQSAVWVAGDTLGPARPANDGDGDDDGAVPVPPKP
jgi:small conductance mechanosensitive channel